MVPSPLQAKVKYKFLEHRGRLSFRRIKKKKKKSSSVKLPVCAVDIFRMYSSYMYISGFQEDANLTHDGKMGGGTTLLGVTLV